MYGECHAHMLMNGRNYNEAVELHKNQIQDSVIHEYFKQYQEAGITFIRDGGDNLGVSQRAREFAPEYGIDYRSPIYAIHKNGYYGGIVGYGFDTIEEYTALVKKVRELHGDFIKIMASGILDFDEFGNVSTLLKDEALIHEMVHIAHEEGFSVMVHVNTPTQIRYALEAGCDSIEHGYYMDEECLRIMKETDAVWVPTLATCSSLRGCGRFNEDAVRKITASHMNNIRLAVEKGVHVATGSDAGAYLVPHAQGLMDEIRYLEEACGNHPVLAKKLHYTLDESLQIIMDRFQRK